MRDPQAKALPPTGSKPFRLPAHAGYALFGLALASLPLLRQLGLLPSSVISYLGNVWICAVAALGLNLLLGYSGLISLGTAGFMGLG